MHYVARAITEGPKYHLKPYYDMQPWDRAGELFICMESDFQNRSPNPTDVLTVGVVELASRKFQPIGTSRAWNFQQGCLPHWIESEGKKEIVYNERSGDTVHAVAVNLRDFSVRELPRPIQALSPRGDYAVGLNFARWNDWRSGYGYSGLVDPYKDQPQPLKDAVYRMDLKSGVSKDLITLGSFLELLPRTDKRLGSPAWFCHLLFNTDGSRVAGLVRFWCPGLSDDVYKSPVNIDGAVSERRHSLWVVGADGGDPEILVEDGLVSHAEWLNEDQILFWGSITADQKPAYVLMNVTDKSYTVIGESHLKEDGHMSFHCNPRWLLTDTYPDADYMRTLKVFDIETNREMVLGRFYAPPHLKGDLRCDLHPCWNRDYTEVAIDSIHDQGARQVYIIEVGDLNVPRLPQDFIVR